MLIDFSKYNFEVLIVTAIFLVILVPYLLIATSLFGYVTSETILKEIETITQQLTPLVIGLLCALLVYHSIKKNKENKQS